MTKRSLIGRGTVGIVRRVPYVLRRRGKVFLFTPGRRWAVGAGKIFSNGIFTKCGAQKANFCKIR